MEKKTSILKHTDLIVGLKSVASKHRTNGFEMRFDLVDPSITGFT